MTIRKFLAVFKAPMLVLNKPTRFGFLLVWSFAGFPQYDTPCCCAADETDVAVETEAAATASEVDARTKDTGDPPLLDLTELLLLLGDLPSLGADPQSCEVPPYFEGPQPCESSGRTSTVRLTSTSEDSTGNNATGKSVLDTSGRPPLVVNPLRSSAPLKLDPVRQPQTKTSQTKPTPDNSTAKESTTKESTPLLILGDEAPSIQLPSDPPTLVMQDDGQELKPSTLDAQDDPPETGDAESIALAPIKDATEELMEEGPQENSTDEPFTIADELENLVTVPGASTSKSTNAGSTNKGSMPKRKLVTVKPLTELDQEAPRLQETPREIDSKQARDEDENAAIAKRPQASKKSFVDSPSDKTTIPQKAIPTKIETAFSPAEVRRKQRVESCLAFYIANPETVVERSPWAVMHAMLPFGVEGEVIVGNKRVNSVQWMCYNGTCRTQKMFTPSGRSFRPNVGGGVQGHEGQFLAMLAQSQVSADYPIVVANKRYSVLDLVRYEMATCREKTELTFKLMALSYYVDTNQSWTAMDRRKWNIEKLVAEELAQPVVGAACGGTHRLMGLTFALRQRKAEGRPIEGHYARAEKFIADYIDYTWTLQNPDGSFSSNWFESRGHEQNKERLVQTTGHILEWLMFTLPKERLEDPRILKSVDFLLNNIWDDRNHKWPIGPRGHATRAIALYQQRVYGVQPGQRHTEMANTINALKLRR